MLLTRLYSFASMSPSSPDMEIQMDQTTTLVSKINGIAVTNTMAIAAGTDTEHASVIKLVRTYLDDLQEFGGVGFEIAPFETAGGTQSREIATLNEQQSTLILTYMRNGDIVRRFKKSLVKAFFELQSQRQTDYSRLSTIQILQIAMQSEQERIALAEKIEEMKPKANGYDLIAGADGSLCLTDAAKELQQRPKDLIAWLSANQWIYKRAGCAAWIGYQDRIQSGFLEHKSNIVIDAVGNERIRDQVRITGKGLAKLAKSFATDINGE